MSSFGLPPFQPRDMDVIFQVLHFPGIVIVGYRYRRTFSHFSGPANSAPPPSPTSHPQYHNAGDANAGWRHSRVLYSYMQRLLDDITNVRIHGRQLYVLQLLAVLRYNTVHCEHCMSMITHRSFTPVTAQALYVYLYITADTISVINDPRHSEILHYHDLLNYLAQLVYYFQFTERMSCPNLLSATVLKTDISSCTSTSFS